VVLDALDAALSWPLWEHLRASAHHDVDTARAIVERLVRGALDEDAEPSK
jgi:hypothetical protein